MSPACRMHHLALEFLQPYDVRILRIIQLADTRNQKVGHDGVRGDELAILSAHHCNLNFPLLDLAVPAALIDLHIEPVVLVQVPFLRHRAEVLEAFFVVGYSRFQSGFCSKE